MKLNTRQLLAIVALITAILSFFVAYPLLPIAVILLCFSQLV